MRFRGNYSGFRRTASVIAIGLACGTAPAFAQDATPEQARPAAAQEQETIPAPPEEQIVVTGSRIRRADFDTPNPVVTISADTIQAAGSTNITEFLTRYPALQGSSTAADNAGDAAGIGATGLNLLDLRNLGPERTLVLVDGRRHVASLPGTAAVDVNTIPEDLVERVEVLTGGASAIYGADGVTGVVNFILKKDFEGVTARAQAGISEHGDAGQRLLAITGGKNFAEGRGNIALSYEYSEEDRLQTRQRKELRGKNLVGFYLNPDDPENQGEYSGPNSNGIPDNIPLNDIRYFDTAREGGIDLDFDGLPDYLVARGGVLTAFDHGRLIPTAYQQGGNATPVADYGNDLLPQVRRHVANAVAHFKVSPAFEIFAEGKYANIKSFSLSQPSFDYYLFIPEDNPFIPDALRPQIAELGPQAVDRGAPGPGVLVTRDNFDFGQRGEDITRETIRAVLGVRGDLSSHLNYEVSYVFGQTNITNHYIGNSLNDRYYAALDAVIDPATGLPTCRVNLDPNWVPDQPLYTAPRAPLPPTTFSPGECIPFNPFGEGNTRDSVNWFLTDTTDKSRIRQQVASAVLTGDLGGLFTLPGGNVGFAVGGEWRKEESRFVPDALAAQGLTYTNALSSDHGEYNVKEAFAELNVPLLKDRPFFHRLEFGGAVRFSDYSTIGSTTTWKVDGAWAPVRDITFTGTYSKAVRAPNISELFSGNSQTFEFITDPCNSNELQNGTQYRAANCAALLSGLGVANPGTYSDTRSNNIPGFSGGNPDLSEEEATTWTVGAIVEPRFIPGLSVRADWYDIRIKSAINTVTSEELAQLCVDQQTLDNPFCGSIVRQDGGEGAGNIVSFTVTPQNVANFRTAGLDLNINYRLRTTSAGTFNLSVVGNYLDRLEFIGIPGAPVTNERGQGSTRAPKYQVTSNLTWQKDKLTLTYGLQWFDKTSRYSNLGMEGNPDIVAPQYLYLKQRWQHDIYASYDVDDHFQFFGGVRNLFNQKPELATTRYPVNWVGRFFFSGVRVKM